VEARQGMTSSGELRSLSPKSYKTLPKLEAPATYVCVIRDIDSDRYRIDATDHPGPFVAAILAEAPRAFGLELISILATADLQKSETALYERHHARLSEQWLELDAVQHEELRRSILKIDAHSSQYIVPQRAQLPTVNFPLAETRYGRWMTSNEAARARTQWRDIQLSRQSPPAGMEASAMRGSPTTVGAWIAKRIENLIWNDPGCLLLIWIGLVALGLLVLIVSGFRA